MRKFWMSAAMSLAVWGAAAADRLPDLKVAPLQERWALPDSPDFAGYYRPCSFYCNTMAKWKVSSFLADQGSNRYGASQCSDFSPKTAWASRGVGEWAELQFFRVSKGKVPTRLTSIGIASGYQKSRQLWADNARPKRLLLQFNGQDIGYAVLPDTQRMQSIRLPGQGKRLQVGDRLRMVITEVYPGRRSEDTCISEIHYNGTGSSH